MIINNKCLFYYFLLALKVKLRIFWKLQKFLFLVRIVFSVMHRFRLTVSKMLSERWSQAMHSSPYRPFYAFGQIEGLRLL